MSSNYKVEPKDIKESKTYPSNQEILRRATINNNNKAAIINIDNRQSDIFEKIVGPEKILNCPGNWNIILILYWLYILL